MDGGAVAVDLVAFLSGMLELPEVAVGIWTGAVPLPVAVNDCERSMFACGGTMRRGFDVEQKKGLLTAAKISACVSGAGCRIPPLTPLPDAV